MTAEVASRPVNNSADTPRPPALPAREEAARGGASAGTTAERASPGTAAAPAAAPAPPRSGRGLPLRWHLLGFAAALLLPVLAFAIGVATEYGAAQRARLEGKAMTMILTPK